MVMSLFCIPFFFFFNDTATTEIYTLSLHDALPIYPALHGFRGAGPLRHHGLCPQDRSEEHTSELQSRQYVVCRLLLEKKKKNRSAAALETKNKSRAVHQRQLARQ